MARLFRSTVAGSLVSPFLLASMLLPCAATVTGAIDADATGVSARAAH